jgi:hypothetical protein
MPLESGDPAAETRKLICSHRVWSLKIWGNRLVELVSSDEPQVLELVHDLPHQGLEDSRREPHEWRGWSLGLPTNETRRHPGPRLSSNQHCQLDDTDLLPNIIELNPYPLKGRGKG